MNETVAGLYRSGGLLKWALRMCSLAALVCALQLPPAAAQSPDPGSISDARYELTELRGVMVPVRDGTHLSADIYLPKSVPRSPAILSIIPYDHGTLRTRARWFASRGFVVIAVDSRGTYNSEGTFDPFDPKHKSDGYDLVEWIAGQPWCSGKVGMLGPSYSAWVQWWTASTAPPHLVAIAPESAPPDQFENIPYQNGVLTGWIVDWAAAMSGRTVQITDSGTYGGWGAHRIDFQHTPYSDINSYRGLQGAPWFRKWYQQNKSTDPYWSAISYQEDRSYSRITVPSLAISGWFDADFPGTPMNYAGMKSHGATPQARQPAIIIGPWSHTNYQRVVAGIDYGPQASIDVDGYIVRWFDHFLKGIDNGVDRDPPVRVFVMGENRWRSAQEWPLPEATPTRFFFVSNGHANSANGDGGLALLPPSREDSDKYFYDPRNPTRDPFETYAKHNGHLDGALDTSSSAMGSDVLVYQTAPLRSDIEVIGPIRATIFAATSALDTDWMIRLVDVQPDGRSLLLADGAMRARNRDPEHHGKFNAAKLSAIRPGEAYTYTISFWRATANRFKQGHRIRVEISSSWYPYFLPNLNSGADNVAMVAMSNSVVAHQAILHGPLHPSSIELPVLHAADLRIPELVAGNHSVTKQLDK